ncbi:hypothetical protein GCM10027445_24200 [Amycolatopsis endophytica]
MRNAEKAGSATVRSCPFRSDPRRDLEQVCACLSRDSQGAGECFRLLSGRDKCAVEPPAHGGMRDTELATNVSRGGPRRAS